MCCTCSCVGWFVGGGNWIEACLSASLFVCLDPKLRRAHWLLLLPHAFAYVLLLLLLFHVLCVLFSFVCQFFFFSFKCECLCVCVHVWRVSSFRSLSLTFRYTNLFTSHFLPALVLHWAPWFSTTIEVVVYLFSDLQFAKMEVLCWFWKQVLLAQTQKVFFACFGCCFQAFEKLIVVCCFFRLVLCRSSFWSGWFW